MEVLHKPETRSAALKSPDCLLKRFLVGLANAHHLADSLHLGSELVFHRAELLKRPARKLQDYIIARRCIFLKRSVAPVWNLVHRHSGGKLCRHKRNREARCLGSKRRRTRRPRIDLDDYDSPALRIMGELDVRSADYAD